MEEPAAAVHTVADLVTRAAERAGDRPALLSGPATLTWAELDELVDRAAGALRGLDLATGDRIVLQLGNSMDFPALYFGALRAGLVAVPANTGYTGPELTHLLQDSGARALVTSSVHVIGECVARNQSVSSGPTSAIGESICSTYDGSQQLSPGRDGRR